MTRRMLGLFAITMLIGVGTSADESRPVRVLIWDEQQPAQKQAYPNFLGNAIAEELGPRPGLSVKSVRLDDPEQGLSKETLDGCDVLIWWGHVRHRDVKPETAREIVRRIKDGKLSLIALHSAHWSLPFIEAMNERTRLDARRAAEKAGIDASRIVEHPAQAAGLTKKTDPPSPRIEVLADPANGEKSVHVWLPHCVFPAVRADGKPSHVRILTPDHPIAKGLPGRFDIPQTEMYDEPFGVPEPDLTVLEETWDMGERFRSGSVWGIGRGKVVYIRPGHETYPILKQPEIVRLLDNTVRWLAAQAPR